MLVLRLLWFYGVLLIFTIRSGAMPTVQESNNTVPKLNKDLADKYGALLKALVSINEQRVDTMKKLYRLQELPVRSTLRSGREVYAVWKIKGKPAWLQELLEEQKTQNGVIYSDDKKIILLKPKKAEVKKESLLEFWNSRTDKEEYREFGMNSRNDVIKQNSDSIAAPLIIKNLEVKQDISQFFLNDTKLGLPREDTIIENVENVLDGNNFRITEPMSVKNPEDYSSLEFWKGSKEVLSEDEDREDLLLVKQSKSNSDSSSLEFWEGSEEVLSTEEGSTFSDDGLIKKIEDEPESSSSDFLKDSKEGFPKQNLKNVDNKEFLKINNFSTDALKEDKKYLLFILKPEVKNSSAMEFRVGPGEDLSNELSQNKKKIGRRTVYRYSKTCSRHAIKYCYRACKDSFDYMCINFKCTSQVEKNYKKECRYACKEEFIRDTADCWRKSSDSDSDSDSNSDSDSD